MMKAVADDEIMNTHDVSHPGEVIHTWGNCGVRQNACIFALSLNHDSHAVRTEQGKEGSKGVPAPLTSTPLPSSFPSSLPSSTPLHSTPSLAPARKPATITAFTKVRKCMHLRSTAMYHCHTHAHRRPSEQSLRLSKIVSSFHAISHSPTTSNTVLISAYVSRVAHASLHSSIAHLQYYTH